MRRCRQLPDGGPGRAISRASPEVDRKILFALEIYHARGRRGASVKTIMKIGRTGGCVSTILKRCHALVETGVLRRYPGHVSGAPVDSTQMRWVFAMPGAEGSDERDEE